MKAEAMKARSRGVSGDMSPRAIASRLDIVASLHELAMTLSAAKRAKRAASCRAGR